MQFTLNDTIAILTNTPTTLSAWLTDMPDTWLHSNEGPDTFSPYEVAGHLVHGEKTDWVVRIQSILEHGTSKPFPKFDRFAHREESKGKPIGEVLGEFERLRAGNVQFLTSLNLSEHDYNREGMHPVLGVVTMRNLLATWAAHDLTHLAQISRVMAKQYKTDVGPWVQFLGVLNWR